MKSILVLMPLIMGTLLFRHAFEAHAMICQEGAPKVNRDDEKIDETLAAAWIKCWKYKVRNASNTHHLAITKGGEKLKESELLALDISSLKKDEITVSIVMTFDQFSFSKSKKLLLLLTASDGKKSVRATKVLDNPFEGFESWIIFNDTNVGKSDVAVGLIGTNASGVNSITATDNELYLLLNLLGEKKKE